MFRPNMAEIVGLVLLEPREARRKMAWVLCLGTRDIPQGHTTLKAERESRNHLPGCITVRRVHTLPSFRVYGADILKTPGISYHRWKYGCMLRYLPNRENDYLLENTKYIA